MSGYISSPYPTLQQVQALLDPAPSWMWTVDITPPGSSVPAIQNIRILTANLPFTHIETVPVFRSASNIYFPHFSNIENITIEFLETEDLYMLKALTIWQSLVVDSNSNYGLPINYMGNILLTLRNNAGMSVGTCTLYGIWPTRIDPWNLTYQGSTHLALLVEFSTNNSLFNFSGFSGLSGLINGNANGGLLV